MRQLPVKAPSISVVHSHEIALSGAQLAKDNHTGSRGIYSGTFVKQLIGTPSIIDPNGRVTANPKGDKRGIILT
jgi:hypothetical protein